eukprot:2356295-Prymnesium_polylepis.1
MARVCPRTVRMLGNHVPYGKVKTHHELASGLAATVMALLVTLGQPARRCRFGCQRCEAARAAPRRRSGVPMARV